jgi:acid phosphatase family membrane protein YuiD
MFTCPSYACKLFLAVFIAGFLSQTIKVIIEWRKTKKFDFTVFYRNGGMPSSHSAVVGALCTSIAIYEGFSTLFVASFIFSGIVLADALGVRRETGKQANIINKLMKKEHIKGKKFTEFVGHNIVQVSVGLTIGIIIALLTLLI